MIGFYCGTVVLMKHPMCICNHILTDVESFFMGAVVVVSCSNAQLLSQGISNN
jgi:hypothetical protein